MSIATAHHWGQDRKWPHQFPAPESLESRVRPREVGSGP